MKRKNRRFTERENCQNSEIYPTFKQKLGDYGSDAFVVYKFIQLDYHAMVSALKIYTMIDLFCKSLFATNDAASMMKEEFRLFDLM